MKTRLIIISLLFSIAILLSGGLLFLTSRQEDSKSLQLQQIVAVNELEQLAIEGDLQLLAEKSASLQDSLRFSESSANGDFHYLFISAIAVLDILAVFCYVYIAILKPFDKMKSFAEKIARGDLDVPLHYERSNYFGDFTWAFDSMRTEITRARACEKEAIENNKTIIATLSHDIKTPIASLRAYAEGLEANMDRSAQKREKYISVILKKCDEVARLTDDLFLHSISDLDRLKIAEEPFELCAFLNTAVHEMSADGTDVHLILPGENIMISADKNRLMQVCENLINNAKKYAKTAVDLSVCVNGDFAQLSFRDHGSGILDDDMPFIFGKFYRGKNCGREQGSGLGLYIVKYITEKMNGTVLLHNHPDGLEVIIRLPLLNS